MFKGAQTASVLAEALQISADAVTFDLALGTTAAWTSLSHMRLVLKLEEILGRRLRPDEIVSLTSAKQVDDLLE